MIYDVSNFLFCMLTIVLLLRVKLIPYWLSIILILYSFFPFFLNDVLFPTDYMEDQFIYTDSVKSIRVLDFKWANEIKDIKIFVNSILYALIPIPFIETNQSLGFFNRFIFMLFFVWVYNKNFLKGPSLFFFIFYPSLVFYTSLSLRDPLILILMVMCVIYFIENDYFKVFLIMIPLFFIKFQNLFFLLFYFFISLIFEKKNNHLIILLSLSLIIILFFFFHDGLIDKIEYYRSAFYWEDRRDKTIYTPINSNLFDFIVITLKSIPYFIFKPLPWETENLFQVIQSIENIIVAIFLLLFTMKAYKQNKFISIKWLLFLFLTFGIYSITIFNFGTAARYKHLIYVVYIIGLSFELFKKKAVNLKN